MGGTRKGRLKNEKVYLRAYRLDTFLDTDTIYLHHKILTKAHVYKLKNPEFFSYKNTMSLVDINVYGSA